MKRRNWILLLACICLLGLSCQNSKKKNTPEAVTESFAKAFYTADFTHMYEYTTKKSDIAVKTMQNAMKNHQERLEEIKNNKVVFDSITVETCTDSTATCVTAVKINDVPRQDKWDLLKENDEWKVTLVLP
jgi:hypothetical protein